MRVKDFEQLFKEHNIDPEITKRISDDEIWLYYGENNFILKRLGNLFGIECCGYQYSIYSHFESVVKFMDYWK